MRFHAWLSLLTLALCVSETALAQQAPDATAEQVDIHAQAQEQFRLGREAQNNGNFRLALRLLRVSYGLEHGRGTLLNIAICEKELGQLATAMQHFQEVLPLLSSTDERLAIVQENMSDLEPRLPHLRVVLMPQAPPGTTVTYDDAELAPAILGTEMPVDPGKHQVIVKAKGRPERQYELMVAESTGITLNVEPGVAPRPPPPLPPPKAMRDMPKSLDAMRTAGIIVGGVGVVGLAVGAVTGTAAVVDHAAAERQCPDHKGCSSDVLHLASKGKSFSIASTVAFAAGAAGVGMGLYLVLSSDKSGSKASPRVGVTLLSDGGRIGLQGGF